jgi:hypothetical protein
MREGVRVLGFPGVVSPRGRGRAHAPPALAHLGPWLTLGPPSTPPPFPSCTPDCLSVPQTVQAKCGLTDDLTGKRVVVQGFGNVGSYAAEFFQNLGKAKIICIVEWDCTVINHDGLDIKALNEWVC